MRLPAAEEEIRLELFINMIEKAKWQCEGREGQTHRDSKGKRCKRWRIQKEERTRETVREGDE